MATSMLPSCAFSFVLLAATAPFVWAISSNETPTDHDVLVFGATPAGIAAAVSAARGGRSVIMVEQHRHLGGMMAGGLGWDDVDCSYCPRTAKPDNGEYRVFESVVNARVGVARRCCPLADRPLRRS